MISDLFKLGLTSYEAKVYKTLLEYGKLDAKQIANYSKVPPTAVYPNLKNLLQKNLIQKFNGEIMTFEAVKPSVAINSLMEQKKKELDSLKNNLIKQSEKIYHQKEIVPEKEVVQISIGREASGEIYWNLLDKAKKTYYIMGWHMSTIGDKYSYLKNFKKALKRGVEIRLISIGKPEKHWGIVDAYLDAGIKIKYLPLENISLVVADGKECKITLKNKEYEKKFNIQVNDPSLSETMQTYYTTIWRKAIPINALRKN